MNILEQKIRQKIIEKGNISVSEFFNIAMFDKDNGYYIKNLPIGRQADFITAPEISQIYGEILACFIQHQLSLNNLNEFQILELGAGQGTLLRDILKTLEKLGVRDVNSYILDINEKLIEEQKNTLKNYKISWISDITQIPQEPTVIIANEFFDALPVKQLIKENDDIFERTIKINDKNRLEFSHSNTPSEEIENHEFDDGDIIEISEESEKFMHKICSLLEQNKGMFLIADYGYIEPIKISSLQSIYKHRKNDIFNNIGDADLTFLVDFKALFEVAKNYKIENIFLQKQGDFLKSMGILERAENLKKQAKNKDLIISSVNRLTSPKYMGDVFKLMILEKYR